MSRRTFSYTRVKSDHDLCNSARYDDYRRLCQWKPLSFKNLPEWLRDNEYLLKGHRPALPNIRVCFESIFRIHTETGNIWTHMLGSLLFVLICAYFTWQPFTQHFRVRDSIVFGTFYFGAILCLGFSFLFHTLCCHSPEMSKLFSKLDYAGIIVLTTVSSTTMLYYGFYCRFDLQIKYLVGLVLGGFLTLYLSMNEQFSSIDWRPLRAAVFTCFGAGGVAPVMHLALVGDWSEGAIRVSVSSMILMGLLYMLGALFYAFRIPERFFPGKFDIWLHSHQILHLLVIGAALSDLYGLLYLARYQLSKLEC